MAAAAWLAARSPGLVLKVVLVRMVGLMALILHHSVSVQNAESLPLLTGCPCQSHALHHAERLGLAARVLSLMGNGLPPAQVIFHDAFLSCPQQIDLQRNLHCDYDACCQPKASMKGCVGGCQS